MADSTVQTPTVDYDALAQQHTEDQQRLKLLPSLIMMPWLSNMAPLIRRRLMLLTNNVGDFIHGAYGHSRQARRECSPSSDRYGYSVCAEHRSE